MIHKYIIVFIFCIAHFIPSDGVAQDKGIKVYVILAEDCPICNYMGSRLAEIGNQFKDKVDLYAVFPVKRSNYKSIHLFKKKYGMQEYKSVLDTDQQLTKKLGAMVTPEVIITDGNENVLYRGRINDAYSAPGKRKMKHPRRELEKNIIAALSGKEISKPWPEAVGCYITFQKMMASK